MPASTDFISSAYLPRSDAAGICAVSMDCPSGDPCVYTVWYDYAMENFFELERLDMNKAYKRFLKMALSGICDEHGIDFADIEKAIDEQDGKGYIEEPDGTQIPVREPNEYAYAVGEGCHIALALDRNVVEAYGVDTGNIDETAMDNLLEAWCVEINDDLADDSGRDGLMYRTLHRVAYDMGFADSDGE